MHTDSPRPEWVHPKDSAAQDGWFVSLGGHDSTTEVPGWAHTGLRVADLGPGDFFGELSVIDQQPRNASVQAVTETRCLGLASWELLQLLQTDSALSLNLIRGLVTRIRQFGEHHRH